MPKGSIACKKVDVVAVGVFDDGVPLPPERVPGLFMPVAKRSKLIELSVDLSWTRTQESQGHPVSARRLRPGRIEPLYKLDGIPRDPRAGRRCRLGVWLFLSTLGDVQAESAVEIKRGFHVMHDDANEVQS